MSSPCAMNQKNWPPLAAIKPLKDWLADARRQLEPISDAPALEAQMLASYVLSRPRSWLLAHSETAIEIGKLEILNAHLHQLAEGYPFAYITGEQEFFGRKFAVKPGILVPRPETEILVEFALKWLAEHPEGRTAVDVGCGSGCISISLAADCRDLSVVAVDIDPEAVWLTKHNALSHHAAETVLCLVGDLLSPINTKFDLVCANLPYIPTGKLEKLAVTRFEPVLALDGGKDGLQLIERLIKQLKTLLATGGIILLEIESSQGESAPQIASKYFPRSEIHIVKDLAGLSRLMVIQS
jgi:release factor glutamine methyltransferase